MGGWVAQIRAFDMVCERLCQRSYGIGSKLTVSALMCETVCTSCAQCFRPLGLDIIAAGARRVPTALHSPCQASGLVPCKRSIKYTRYTQRQDMAIELILLMTIEQNCAEDERGG